MKSKPKKPLSVNWSSPRLAGRSIRKGSAMDRIEIVRAGVPAAFVLILTKHTGLKFERLCEMAGLEAASIAKKAAQRANLDLLESERILGFVELIEQAQSIAKEAKLKENSAKWVGGWLDRPQLTLGGRRPGDLMDTADGREMVRSLLFVQKIATGK